MSDVLLLMSSSNGGVDCLALIAGAYLEKPDAMRTGLDFDLPHGLDMNRL